ncbi:MAG: hypothetical protein HOP28_17280 [Gemmatimonadales bacterium]|nr:hypothetical protein [Gemmatimonadales bacterium]
MAKRRPHLVIQHVERMSRKILEEHPEVVREYVKGKRGVYALYKRTRLYYVGLASNLRSRLKAHLKDRHGRAWDFFSMYLTDSDDHLRELEALTLRITLPKGNRSKTKFVRSQDLRRYFKRKISEQQRKELSKLFGPSGVDRVRRQPERSGGKEPSLARYVTARMPIRWIYRGKLYRAVVRSNGKIKFKGKVYDNPSLAGSKVSGRATNGWTVWLYEATPGEWVPLDRLRRRR